MAVLLFIGLALVMGCSRSPEAKKARYLERGDRYFKQEKYREATLEYRNALRLEENNAHAVRQLGLAHYQTGEMGQAYRYLLRAQQLTPDDLDVRKKLGTIYLLGAKPNEAREQAEAILQRDPKNLEALLLLAGVARTPQEIDGLVARLEKVRQDLPGQAKPLVILASLYLRKNDAVTAERYLRGAVSQEPKSVEAHGALANLYLAKRDNAQAESELRIAADLAPVGSPARTRLADFYLLLGRRDEARKVLNDITAKAPDYVPAWRLLSQIAFAEGKLDDSAKAVEMVLKSRPGDVEGRLMRGRIHLARRETPQAIQEFQAVLKTEPRLGPAHYQLALAQLQGGNVQQAKAELKATVTTAPNYAEAVILLAEINLQSGAAQVAIEDLERFVAAQPQALPAYVVLGAAYLAAKRPADAIEVGRKLAGAAPRDPRGPYLIGLGLGAQGKRPAARQQLEASLNLAPQALEPLAQLVSLTFADRQPAQAIERVKKQVALVPKSAPHRMLLGETYAAAGDLKAAEAAFQQAIELDPNLMEPYVKLGGLYAAAGRYDEALAKVNDAAKRNPRDVGPLMLEGIIFEQKGEVTKARESYEKALAINPHLAPAANNLAWIYSEHGGDKEKALQLAQMAKEMAPDDPRISDTLGWILYKRGVYQRALSLLRESAEKLPANPQVQYHVGMAYAQLGDKDNARKALTAATSTTAEFFGKDDARKTLAALK